MSATGNGIDDDADGPGEGEFHWPAFMVKTPDAVPPVLYGLSSAFGLATSQCEGTAQKLWLVASLITFLVAVAFNFAIGSAKKQFAEESAAWIEKAKDEHRLQLQSLLGEELHNLIHLVADAAATKDAPARKTKASQARQSIICAAANMVGRSATTGTRANLFRLSYDRRSMKLEPNGFFGRGDRSERSFHVGDKTFDLMMQNRTRWVPEVADEPALAAQNLKYETFLVHPVSIGKGQVFGALTVDCMRAGDLDEQVDTPMMAVLSTLIALTYVCEK